MKLLLSLASLALLLLAPLSSATAAEPGWIDLTPTGNELKAWEGDNGWTVAGDAALDAEKPRGLTAKPGQGVLVSSLQGRADYRTLASRRKLGDAEVLVVLVVHNGAIAGVKLQGLYEVQIKDSHGKKKPTADDCGGVYPRAELTPRYHLIDKGVPPRMNAARPAGQWQTLDVVFQAPRFDAAGKKTHNARFVKVLLNGQVIHEDVELKWPTGHAWRKEKEAPLGPLFLQGDHGPVAYRNVRVRPK